jgi:hypothetical protein
MRTRQTAAMKDVEKAFGILQAQFTIVRGPARFWDQNILWYIINACVMMHNMIIKFNCGEEVDHAIQVRRNPARVACFINSYNAIRNPNVHDYLHRDLIEEWWTWFGQQPH